MYRLGYFLFAALAFPYPAAYHFVFRAQRFGTSLAAGDLIQHDLRKMESGAKDPWFYIIGDLCFNVNLSTR